MNEHALEKRLHYRFSDSSLLTQALTHASKAPKHLERLEFLGDSVLGLVISEYLYHQYPNEKEGVLSKMKANLVCKQSLLHISEAWQLAQVLHVGDGERDKAGRLKSESIAADAVESVIGAVFLDGGWQAAKNLVLKAWQPLIAQVSPGKTSDAKSQLQELTQAHALGLPKYTVRDLGVQHSPRFEAVCTLQGEVLGKGLGQRKKEAELRAAQNALDSAKIP